MCVSEGRVAVMMVCGGGSVGVLMRFVWRSLGVGRGVLGGGGWVSGGVGGWASEFWTSDIVYMLILTISMSTVCLTQFGQENGLSESWKNTLQFWQA